MFGGCCFVFCVLLSLVLSFSLTLCHSLSLAHIFFPHFSARCVHETLCYRATLNRIYIYIVFSTQNVVRFDIPCVCLNWTCVYIYYSICEYYPGRGETLSSVVAASAVTATSTIRFYGGSVWFSIVCWKQIHCMQATRSSCVDWQWIESALVKGTDAGK